MALPPQVIKLKRKAGDQPVETLLIQRQWAGLSDNQTIDGSYRFKRLRIEEVPLRSPGLSGSEVVLLDQKSAAVHTDLAEGLSALPSDLAYDKTAMAKPTLPKKQDEGHRSATPEPSAKPKRVFHLSKENAPRSPRRSSSASSLRVSQGIRKRRRSPHGAIAVVSELKKTQIVQYVEKELSNQGSGNDRPDEDLPDAPPRAQKRPNASASERNWRNEHWTKPLATETVMGDERAVNDPNEEKSLALAAELQQFALDETQKPWEAHTTPGLSHGANLAPASGDSLLARQLRNAKPLKYQPKPQPPRNREPPTVTADEDTESEWVYDTYIREPNEPSPSIDDTATDKAQQDLRKNETDNIGYLIIAPEDELVWEQFMSDGDGSEEETWEDENDSNAEDYYANDYPEDEDEDEDWVGSNHDKDSSFGSQDDQW